MLRCSHVTLAVPGRVLVGGLSAEFGAGEVWAVLGRNGTGKSTLIHALSGLARPAAGTIELEGRAVDALDARERAEAIGVLLQLEEGTYWGSVADYVLLGRFPHASAWSGFGSEDVGQARAALEAVGMGAFASQRYHTLSGGERQRVRIAQILAQRPRVLLLDEPLQHLDLAHQAQVLKLFAARAKGEGTAAVMVLHEPLWIGRSCTHALVLADGRAESGPVDTLLTRERLEHAYGLKLREIAEAEGRCFVPDV